ncbi:MAG: pyridoxamine 5'-phosphate oxidase family protein [Cyanobacteria bacterium]|nr:pyridoxamine 5'-phosphate oxidase family protein [Cyanobacteriota bacterium]
MAAVAARGPREEGRSSAARWLQFASVASDGTPRVRTLVFRGWADGSVLDLLTDGRSAKAAELRQQPAVELCWLLPRARCQFRLRGRRLALPADVEQQQRQRQWQSLTPSGRALWGWPAPGAALAAAEEFPGELTDEVPLHEQFQLLRIALEQVELLELRDHPHQRRRWCRADGWSEEHLTP